MLITIAVILLVLLIGYYWLSKGAFSALLHLACVVAAGAIAFALWEPLSMMLVRADGPAFLEGIAWTAGLLVPFTLAIVVLRLVTDKLIPGNVHQTGLVDLIGGAVFGLASGVIVTGMIVIAMGYARLPANFGGYRPVFHTESQASGGGSLVRRESLSPPVDRIVAGVYGLVSRGTLATSNPLGRWRPDVDLAGPAARITPEGKGRTAIAPEDFSVDNRYRIGSPESPQAARDLLALPDGGGAQGYFDASGEPVTSGHVEGFVITFQPGAKETGGDFIFGPGQVHLVAESADGSHAETIFPFAMVSQATSENADAYGRWAFQEGDFIASIGGASSFPAAFEFLVPAGYRPIALYVKNTRYRLDPAQQPQEFATAGLRDRAVASGSLFSGATSRVTSLDRQGATTIAAAGGRSDAVRVDPGIGASFNAQNPRGLVLNGQNQVVGGTAQFFPAELNPRGTDTALLVREFAAGSGQTIVQVNVSNDSPASMQNAVVRSQDASATPRLVDSQGVAYDAIGYIYQDKDRVEIRYTPGEPIRSRNELPPVSSIRSDQTLTLIFVVSAGVNLTDYAVGEKSVLVFQPPLQAAARRGR